MDVNELLSTVETKARSSKPKNTKKEDKSFNNVMESISSNWKKPIEPGELEKLKNELEKAKAKIEALESTQEGFTKNEKKIIAAIKSESLKQNTDMPIISYNTFRKTYKVSSDYYRPSIESLIKRKVITREEAIFSGDVKTKRWKIVQ